jgi:hypothetical protein
LHVLLADGVGVGFDGGVCVNVRDGGGGGAFERILLLLLDITNFTFFMQLWLTLMVFLLKILLRADD